MNWKLPNLITLGSVLLVAGCGSVTSKDTVYRDANRYPPHSGELDVYWKEKGPPADLRQYEFIATVKGSSTWCGLTKGMFNTDLHKYIVSRAGEVGGDALVLYCGELGTTGECDCYGDVYRRK